MDTLQNFIDGVWQDSASSEVLAVVDPATEEQVALIPAGSEQDVDDAVAAARRAQPGWARVPLAERVAKLVDCADLLAADLDELVDLERRDMGKPADVGKPFTEGAIEYFRGSVLDALSYSFETVIGEDAEGTTRIVRHPLGVAALLAPWNFTISVILSGLGPLLASGNTVVVKPSEKSPLSAVRLFELLADQLPPGVLNLVLGGGDVGRPLAAHSDVDVVHFTGSVRTGKAVSAAAAGNLVRAVLELGGKDPVVVDADVDVASTASAIAYGAFANTGQICTSMERIYVHRDVAESFVSELVEAAKRLAAGEGDLAELGPLVDAGQRELVHRHVLDAVERGATIEVGGEIPTGRGFFYPPTVITGVDDSMLIMSEETFGPIAPIQVVDTFEAGLELAAATEFGLGATVYTNDPEHIQAAKSLPAGIVWINRWQGGAPGMIYEPAKNSGLCAIGGTAGYDAATRPSSVYEAALVESIA